MVHKALQDIFVRGGDTTQRHETTADDIKVAVVTDRSQANRGKQTPKEDCLVCALMIPCDIVLVVERERAEPQRCSCDRWACLRPGSIS
jgi:hypothetical protein